MGRFLKSHCGQIFNVLIRGDLRTIVGCESQDSGLYWIRFVVVFQPIQNLEMFFFTEKLTTSGDFHLMF